MLSIIIPTFKDKDLNRTIESLLSNATGDIEIIPVLDGAPQDVLQDERVHPILLNENRGLRNAVNVGVRMARGEYIGKCDAHCVFGKGYDQILTQMEDNWIVTPPRYFLDTDKWEVMPDEPRVYDKLVIDKERNKFSGVNWQSRTDERKDIPIDENMMFQGSFWVMSKKWWNTIGELDLAYGRFTQEPTELVFKTWQKGGKLMINKNTWYAHKHRKFSRTHQVSREESEEGFAYALNKWRDYYEQLKWT